MSALALDLNLLVQVEMTPKIRNAISKLVLLSKDPAIGSIVLEFIYSKVNVRLTATRFLEDGRLMVQDGYNWIDFSVKSVTEISKDRGVYLWTAKESSLQYVGSTINMLQRRSSQVHDLCGPLCRSRGEMLVWAKANGGLAALNWTPLYITFNYYFAFLAEHPNYSLTARELILLKAITELLPRILEVSLLSHLDLRRTKWNKQTSVSFSFLSINRKDKVTVSPVEIRSLDNQSAIRPPYLNHSLAKDRLDLSGPDYLSKLNNKAGFFSKVFNQNVTINQTDHLLVKKPDRKQLFFIRKAQRNKRKAASRKGQVRKALRF